MRISDWSSDVCSSDLGREPNFSDSSAATREFGGWSLPDNGGDHFIGNGPHDAAIFVANVDNVMAYTNFIDLEIGGIGAAMDAVATARGRLRATENDFRSAERRVGKVCVSPCRSRWSPVH